MFGGNHTKYNGTSAYTVARTQQGKSNIVKHTFLLHRSNMGNSSYIAFPFH